MTAFIAQFSASHLQNSFYIPDLELYTVSPQCPVSSPVASAAILLLPVVRLQVGCLYLSLGERIQAHNTFQREKGLWVVRTKAHATLLSPLVNFLPYLWPLLPDAQITHLRCRIAHPEVSPGIFIVLIRSSRVQWPRQLQTVKSMTSLCELNDCRLLRVLSSETDQLTA